MSMDEIVDSVVNYVSYGTVGYEGDGKFGKGYMVRGADEIVGEVTGRNQARKALFEQRDAARAAIDEKRRLRMEEIRRRGIQQKNLSENVQATRQIAEAGGSATGLGGAGEAAGPLNEFLGLG